MNTKILFVSILFLLSLLCGIGAGITYINHNPQNFTVSEGASAPPDATTDFITEEKPSRSEEINQDTKSTTVDKKEQYVVTLSDTKIFIYKIATDGSMQTIEEKNINTGAIPSSDYAKLYSGIVVDSLEEAKLIVEDYIS